MDTNKLRHGQDMKSKKVLNIQALRGIAVLLVVFSHMLPIENKYSATDKILPDIFMIGISGVDLFFLISGFVMVSVTQNTNQSISKIKLFLYHRFTRIYPLYWFYSILILTVFLLQPSMVNNSQDNQIDIISSFLLIPQDLLPIVNVGWTLVFEIYFYIIFSLLLLLPRKKLTTGLLLWGIVILAVSSSPLWRENAFTKVYFHPLTLEFIIGAFIAIVYYKRDIPGNAKLLALASIVIWLVSYTIFQSSTNENIPKGIIRVIIFGIPASLALYSALLYEKNHNITMPNWLCKIGDASYSIYLSHIIVLSIVGRVWSKFSTNGALDNFIAFTLMLIAVLISGFISYKLIEGTLLIKTRKLERYIFNKNEKPLHSNTSIIAIENSTK